MAPRHLVPAVLLLGALAVTPAFAQHARGRGDGNRGGGSEGRREGGGGDGGGARAVPRSPNGGGGGGGRSYDRPRQYDARQNEARQYQSRPESGNTESGNNVARADAYRNGYRAGSNNGYRAGSSDGYRAGSYNGYRAGSYNAYAYRGGQPYAYQHRAVPRPYAYSYRPPAYYSRYPYAYNRYYVRPYYAPRYVYPHVVTVIPYQPYYYRPRFSIGVYYGAGGAYPYGATPSYYYDPSPGQVYGGIRITDAPREAQVFADGYYVGIVDDFDGVFQHVNLEAGEHQIEIRAPGLQPIAFDVAVQPGRTITLRADIN